MQKITMFMFPSCPYCVEALDWMKELKLENPQFNDIPFTMIDENRQRALADEYDYWFVPTYYIGEKKVHEGAATKEIVKSVYERALQE